MSNVTGPAAGAAHVNQTPASPGSSPAWVVALSVGTTSSPSVGSARAREDRSFAAAATGFQLSS